ncbi:DEKNAAC100252 [Brettanomyces naardenensis]|uniref:MFS-type drug efflux transporter P55 n=1 Tax=Brettanomyces naardenensis TaxID=13370 RepID=A0A448YEK1_BRENA|nr:DEKNAAC100252 [Brettanomyces naardenensis]
MSDVHSLASADSDDNEVRPFLSNNSSLPPANDLISGLPDLTSVTSTSLAGLVAEDVLDSVSRHGEDEESAYGSIINRQRSNHSVQSAASNATSVSNNDGYLVSRSKLIVILSSLFALVFLAALDATILSTLVTDIASDLDAIPYISYITTAYLLSTSIVQPLGGLSDIFGRKIMLQGCIIIFTVGCLQCATARTTGSFVAGRFLSGFAGGLNTLGTIIMSDLIPLRKRGVYQGFGNMFYALGSAVGGTIGGWIAHRFGWRAAFWVQVPIGTFCFLLIAFNLQLPAPKTDPNTKKNSLTANLKRVDVAGITSLAVMLSLFIFLTSFSFSSSATQWLVAGLFLAALGLFIYIELTVREAIVPISLLKDRSVLGSSLSNMFGTMYIFVVLYYYPVYLSTVSGLNSEEIGIRLVPMIVVGSLASVFSGYYMKWTGKYWTFSVIVNAFGTAGLVLMLLRTYPFGLKVLPSVFEQYILNVLPDVAYATLLTVTLLSLIAAVPVDRQSSVTSIQYAFRGIGSVLGTAVGSEVFSSMLSKEMVIKLAAVRPSDVSDKEFASVVSKVLHNAAYIRTKAPKWGINAMIESYGIGCWWSFVFATVMSVFALVNIIMIKEYKLYSSVKRNR